MTANRIYIILLFFFTLSCAKMPEPQAPVAQTLYDLDNPFPGITENSIEAEVEKIRSSAGTLDGTEKAAFEAELESLMISAKRGFEIRDDL